jgi:glycosyltransferase involved in cell wall biosynthesis
MPKVSVIMAVFNGERFLRDSIASVLNQSFTDLELITIDDSSTDGSLQILESFAQADARVRIITRPNSGRPAVPKNNGIAAATGDYICFLDQDDLYHPDRLRQLVQGLDGHPDWLAVFCDMQYIDARGGPRRGTYLGDFDFVKRAAPYLTPLADDWFECGEQFFVFQALASGALHTATVMIAHERLPAELLKFDTRFSHADDVDLWMRLGQQGKLGYLNRQLASYRSHENNLSRRREHLEIDTALLHKHNFARIQARLNARQRRLLRRRVANCVRSVAYVQHQKLQVPQARAAYRESLAWAPSIVALLGLAKTFIPAGLLRRLRAAAKT